MSEHKTATTSAEEQEWVPYSFNGMKTSRYYSLEVQEKLDARLGPGNHRFEEDPTNTLDGRVMATKIALDAMRLKMEK